MLRGIMGAWPAARCEMVQCDTRLNGDPIIFEGAGDWSVAGLAKKTGSWRGRGGTNLRPIFDWAKTRETEARVLIVVTDGEFADPGREAAKLPTIWLTTTGRAPAWGRTVKLDMAKVK